MRACANFARIIRSADLMTSFSGKSQQKSFRLSVIPGTQKRWDVSFLISLSIRIICVVFLQQDGVLVPEADEEDSSPPPSSKEGCRRPKKDAASVWLEGTPSVRDDDNPASVSQVPWTGSSDQRRHSRGPGSEVVGTDSVAQGGTHLPPASVVPSRQAASLHPPQHGWDGGLFQASIFQLREQRSPSEEDAIEEGTRRAPPII